MWFNFNFYRCVSVQMLWLLTLDSKVHAHSVAHNDSFNSRVTEVYQSACAESMLPLAEWFIDIKILIGEVLKLLQDHSVHLKCFFVRRSWFLTPNSPQKNDALGLLDRWSSHVCVLGVRHKNRNRAFNLMVISLLDYSPTCMIIKWFPRTYAFSTQRELSHLR